MELSVIGKNNLKILAKTFSPFFHLHCCRQVASIFTFFADCSVKLLKLKCLRSIESLILRVIRKRCSVGTLFCTQCPNFSRKSENALNYRIVEKHSKPNVDVTFKCKLHYQEFLVIYALRQHRSTQHGMQIASGTRDVDVEHIVGDVEDHRLREELRSCHYFLVDSELERARHKVFNYAVETLNETIVNAKFDHFLNKLKCAAKVFLAFAFILKKVEDGRFRYFYEHENKTLLDRFKLVCTRDDLAKLKDILNKSDVIESCSRENQ